MGAHRHDHGEGSGGLKVAFLLNLIFTAIEVAGGMWTNSIAILSDALHDGGDTIAIGVSWYLQKRSGKDADARFTYGYRRYSVLGALLTGGVLCLGLGFVLWHAVQRIAQPQAVRAPGMIALAVLGIVVNGFAAWRTRRGTSLTKRS